MKATCRWAGPDDVPRIKAFFSESFGPDSFQSLSNRFEWLFLHNPAGFHAAVAETNGRVVAFRGYLPFACEPLTDLRAAFGMDFLVLRECRGQGIGREILELAIERFDVAVAVGPTPANTQLHRNMGGCEIAGLYSAFCRCRRPRRFTAARACAREWASFVYHRCLAVRGATLRQADLGGACDVLGRLHSRLSPTEWGSRRDADFIRWRYAAGPYSADYAFLELRHRDLPAGIAVVRHVPGGSVALVDVFCDAETRIRALRVLASCGLADSVTSYLGGESLRGAFLRAGYVVRPVEAVVYAISRDAGVMSDLRRRRWTSFSGDSDMDLIRRPAAVGAGV